MITKPKKSSLSILTLLTLTTLSHSVNALDTGTIIFSTVSPECIEYRVVGVCYWLLCTPYGCKVKTSVKVKHYVPDAVVSSYMTTGQSPWLETSVMGMPVSGAEGGGDGVTSQANENNIAKFKNVDVIGHPGIFTFNNILSSSGYSCAGAGMPFVPYYLSTLDIPGWRYNIPEAVYPESLTPGVREVGSRTSTNLWGNVYPRGGFSHQVDDYKAAAVAAQRAGDIVTRRGQPHVYMPLLATRKDGYWPAGALKESDAATGKWQDLAPSVSQSCKTFPDSQVTHEQAEDGAYAWALWRPYSCCKRRGQVFLGSTGN